MHEEQLFAVCTLIFVDPLKSEHPLTVLRHAIGGKRCEYVLALPAFIRTAHFWTVIHPGIEIEDDVKQLMTRHKELAVLLLQEPATPTRVPATGDVRHGPLADISMAPPAGVTL